MTRQPILILSFSPLDRDPRVQRQIEFLRQDYQITAAGFSDPGVSGVTFIRLPPMRSSIMKKGLQALRLKSGRFESYYWNVSAVREARKRLAGMNWRLVLANDLHSLPLGLELARSCAAKVLVDAHEYEPRHFDDDWQFNFFFKTYWDYIARHYLPQVDKMTTVCEGIAREYKHTYGVSSDVITNASHFYPFEPSKTVTDRVRMIHHGICHPSRRLENMIDLMDHLDERFTLDMMLVPDNRRYFKRLVKRANATSNVRIRRPVALDHIVPRLHEYDLGLFLLAPNAFNYRMALPNKFFEFVQARLGIAIWPSPEMAKFVHAHKLGIIAQAFSVDSAAKALNGLSAADIRRFKTNSHAAASLLCAEQNRDRLNTIVRQLIGA